MKKNNIIFWVSTVLFAAFMIFTAVPNITQNTESMEFMASLGYPRYFVPFIGILKVLGCIAILTSIPPTLKEWAYAGLAFDLIGAIYSVLCASGFDPAMLTLIPPIAMGVISYIYYHKIQKQN